MEGRKRGRPRKGGNAQNVENGEAFQDSTHIENIIEATNFDFVPENSPTPEIGGFNPLGDAPIKRDYSSPTIDQGVSQELAEPSFHKTTFSEAAQEKETILNTASQESQSIGAKPPEDGDLKNPALNQLDDQEKRLAAEQLVDAAIDTYETLWSLAGGMVQVSDKKIKQLVKDGKLDPQLKIPIDEQGTEVTAIEFIQSFNAQVPEAVEADPAFRKKVRAPLTRIFEKKGWGMTDEQVVLFAVIKDSATKGMAAYALKKTMNQVLEQLQEQTQLMKAEGQGREKDYDDDLEVEEITDVELEYERRMAELRKEQKAKANRPKRGRGRAKKTQADPNIHTDKMDINFDDNPLRTERPTEYPQPKVKEVFTKAEEVNP